VTMQVAIVLGTRPEIIKMSPVIHELRRRGLAFTVVHTGQHYSEELDAVFFRQLDLPAPDIRFHVGSGSHAEQTSRILLATERFLRESPCDCLLVQGDTNTVLGASLAAAKMGVRLGHVEAGLRSGDNSMPEEQNRKIADCLSDLLFAPTEHAAGILRAEGKTPESIFVTGNTVVDALMRCKGRIPSRGDTLARIGLEDVPYIALTLHRPANVDRKHKLVQLLNALYRTADALGMVVVWPTHPRARRMLEEFGFAVDNRMRLLPPLGYFEFLGLMSSARLILTDSGGVQEEACILGVPCVTLRDSTERPETLEVGSNMLAGSDGGRIIEAAEQMLARPTAWENPFGNGDAGKRIVDVLCSQYPAVG